MNKGNVEDEICKALNRWMFYQHKMIFPMFNFSMGGNNLSPARRGICKAMGYKAGWPDYMLAAPVAGYHGMFLEVKSETGSCSDEQRSMLNALRNRGYACAVGYGLDECRDLLRVYISGQSSMDYRFDIDTKLERKFFLKEHPDVFRP